jgi:hypothetical protein
MNILNCCEKQLTNTEVLTVLHENGLARENIRANRTVASRNVLEKDAMKYLSETCKGMNSCEQAMALVQKLKALKFNLEEGELLNILNGLPTELIDLFTVYEATELSEDQQTTLLTTIREFLEQTASSSSQGELAASAPMMTD